MTSQLVIFRAFFSFLFFVSPTLNRKKNSGKSTNKKNLALANSSLESAVATSFQICHGPVIVLQVLRPDFF